MRGALKGVGILLGVVVASFVLTAAVYLLPIVAAWILGKDPA